MLESELNANNKYEIFRDEDDKTRKTLLHYASELGFLQVTQTLVKKCPTSTTKKMIFTRAVYLKYTCTLHQQQRKRFSLEQYT